MPALTADEFIEAAIKGATARWISDAENLSRFGSFIDALQPGAESSIKHWHNADDVWAALDGRPATSPY